ncbi:response regulator transcription factor [Arthrobacter sp. ISL-85]|uniref:response regulator transcription factor n=1 Tax=Arthrobacter sp. ISL-85 TaxID=2819115 RepID=UPI00288A9446|nr:response regulator transcription factor [Arthrobacter sp. ISL-85]
MSSAGEGVKAVAAYNPVVVTMDVGLPDFGGIEALRRIRGFSEAYLIMISRLADEADAVIALEAGADDYITKPFRPRELLARVRALLRRPRTPAAEAPTADHGHSAAPTLPDPLSPTKRSGPVEYDFEHHGLRVHEATRTVEVDGAPVHLTRTKFDLLLALMDNGRRVQTRAELVPGLRNEPYGSGTFVSSAQERAVEVHTGQLRRNLGDDHGNPRWIETVRGVGYRLT